MTDRIRTALASVDAVLEELDAELITETLDRGEPEEDGWGAENRCPWCPHQWHGLSCAPPVLYAGDFDGNVYATFWEEWRPYGNRGGCRCEGSGTARDDSWRPVPSFTDPQWILSERMAQTGVDGYALAAEMAAPLRPLGSVMKDLAEAWGLYDLGRVTRGGRPGFVGGRVPPREDRGLRRGAQASYIIYDEVWEPEAEVRARWERANPSLADRLSRLGETPPEEPELGSLDEFHRLRMEDPDMPYGIRRESALAVLPRREFLLWERANPPSRPGTEPAARRRRPRRHQ